jgi:hypothetical protein
VVAVVCHHADVHCCSGFLLLRVPKEKQKNSTAGTKKIDSILGAGTKKIIKN